MKKIYFLIAMVTATVLASCTKEQEDFFSDSSANRADAAVTADIQVLTSAANGWLMKYYPEAQQSYGGFNMIARFTADGKVEVMSELDESTSTSLYKVSQSAGITLTFDTYNVFFHAFSDPSAPLGGEEGTGLDGDYDFSILKATAEEVVLKGKKTGNRIVMTPMASNDWKGYLSKIAAVEANMASNFYQVKIDTTIVPVTTSGRTLVFTYKKDGEETETIAPYIITPEGLEFYKPVEVLNAKMTGFKNVNGVLSFEESTGSGLKLEKVKKDPAQLFLSSDWWIAYSMLGAYAQKYWDVMQKAEAAVGESVGYAYFTNSNGMKALTFYSSGYVGNFYFNVNVLGTDMIELVLRSYDSNGQWYYQNAGWNYAVNPFRDTFKVSTDNEYMPTVLVLQSVKEPTNTIQLSLSSVYYPFRN